MSDERSFARQGRWWLVVLALVWAQGAFAERGLFIVSVQSGQVMNATPEPLSERSTPVFATLAYGLSERWSLGVAGSVEFAPPGATLTLSLGPRFTLFRNNWWTLETLLAPEALWRPAAGRFDYGARLGLSVRYLLAWGLGVVLEGGVRGRAEASGPFSPSLQGYLVGGLYIEA